MGPLFYCFVILYVASVLAQGGYNCMSLRSVSSLPHPPCSFSDNRDANHLTHMHTHTDFNLWLKSLTNPDGTRRWSVAQINAIPIGGSAIAGTSPPSTIHFLVPSTTSYPSLSTIPYAKLELILPTVAMIWVWGFISDYFQTRWIPVVIQASIGLIPGIIMSIWNVSDNAKYFSCGSMFLPSPLPFSPS